MLNCMPPSDANLLLLLAKGMRNRLLTFPLLDQQVYFFSSSAHMNGIGLNEFYIILYKIRLTQYYRCSFYFKFFLSIDGKNVPICIFTMQVIQAD